MERPAVPEDAERYQNIFASNEGAVVVPAAGLHFSRELIKRMEIKNIDYGFLRFIMDWVPTVISMWRISPSTRSIRADDHFSGVVRQGEYCKR